MVFYSGLHDLHRWMDASSSLSHSVTRFLRQRRFKGGCCYLSRDIPHKFCWTDHEHTVSMPQQLPSSSPLVEGLRHFGTRGSHGCLTLKVVVESGPQRLHLRQHQPLNQIQIRCQIQIHLLLVFLHYLSIVVA